MIFLHNYLLKCIYRRNSLDVASTDVVIIYFYQSAHLCFPVRLLFEMRVHWPNSGKPLVDISQVVREN